MAGDGRPVLERRGEISYRAKARGARAARKRVCRTRELIGSLGLGFQRLDVLQRFLGIDVEEAACEARGADRDLLGLRLHGPQLLSPFHDRPAVESEALPAAQPAYPFPEGRARQGDQLEQLGGGRLLPLEPAVHDLLDFPGHLAEIGQADHAAASLQGMKAAADRRQHVAVAGPLARARQRRIDIPEHFARFLEEDVEQAFGFRRRLRLAGFFLRLLGRRRARGAFLVAAEKKLDRLVGRIAPVDARRQEQAEAAEAFGDPVHVLQRGVALAGGAGLDQRFAERRDLGGALESQHGERAMDLPQVSVEAAERLARRQLARVGIEHLLHVLEIGEDLLRHLRAQLQRADLLAEIGAQPGGRLAGRFALRGIEQPAAHDADLLLQVGRRAGEILEHALRQQEGRGHLDDHELALRRIRVGEPRRDEGDGVQQLDQVLVAELGGLRLEPAHQLAEPQHALRLAGHVLLPHGLQRVQPRARVAQDRLQPVHVELHLLAGGLGRRDQAVEAVEQLDILEALRRRLGARDQIQHFAQQRIVDRLRAGSEVPHVEIDLVAEHLGARLPVGLRRIEQAVDEPDRDPGERARLGELRRDLVERVERLAHVLRAGGRAAQPGQQPALETRALRLQMRRQLVLCQRPRAGMRRRRRGQIGEEQLLFGAVGLALQLRELPIDGKQPQRHVRLAARHVVDELLQGEHRAVDDADRRRAGPRAVRSREAAFDRFAEARRAAQPHHAQRPAHLVQVLGAYAERSGIVRGRGKLRDAVAHVLQRLIHFGGDPGQDGGVGHGPVRRA